MTEIRSEGPARHILSTLIIAFVTGVSSALTVALFRFCLEWLLRTAETLKPAALAVLPFVTAFAVGLMIMRRYPAAGGEGVQHYIDAVNKRDGKIDTAETFLRFPATLLTLAFFGSGGTVGPLARICAGIGSLSVGGTLGKSIFSRRDDVAVGAICGVSGAVSAIFHAPLAAGLYATEILHRESIRYTDLVVALLAAVVSLATSRLLLGEVPLFRIDAPDLELSAVEAFWLLVTAAAGGLIGLLFIYAQKKSAVLFRRIPGRQPVQALAAAVILSAAFYAGLGTVMRTTQRLYEALTMGEASRIMTMPGFEIHEVLPFIGVILAIVLLSAVTIGCGMSAGFTGPLIMLGMTLGALIHLVSGGEQASSSFYCYMACGMAALLSTTLNIPLASIALTMTVFGTSYILPAVTGSSIAFILFKSSTVYSYYETADGGEQPDTTGDFR